MCNLELIIIEIKNADIRGDFWVDGSFLTRKSDPKDVDVVFHVREGQGFSVADQKHTALINWLHSNLKISHGCDSYVNVIPPVFHLAYSSAMKRFSYWERQFGLSRGGMNKGIAVLKL